MNSSFVRVFFSVFSAVLFSGCVATVPQSGKKPEQIRAETQTFSGNESVIRKWDALIDEGKTFAVDFSDPIFSKLWKPSTAKRLCNRPQSHFLKDRSKKRIVICYSIDSITTSFSWYDQTLSLDDFVASSDKRLSEIEKEKGSSNQFKTEKLKEEKGVTYYHSYTVTGEGFDVYRAFFVFETKKTKEIGVKIAIEAQVSNKVYPKQNQAILEKLIQELKEKIKEVE